jgi:hypothetical protein
MGGGLVLMAGEPVGRVDCEDVFRLPEEGTNTVSFSWVVRTEPSPASVGGTVEYAIAHYENLLRRLAD